MMSERAKKTPVPLIVAGIVAAVIVGAVIVKFGASGTRSVSPPKKAAAAKAVPRPASMLTPDEAALRVACDAEQGDSQRLEALGRLGRSLTPEQVAQVRELMNDRAAPPTIRNDAFEVLARQVERPQGLGYDLAYSVKDGDETRLGRDFALQHMVQAYVGATPKEKELTRTTLVATAKDAQDPSSGTALLSIQRLGGANPEFRQTGRKLACEAALAEDADSARVMSAMHVAAEAGETKVLPRARRVAAAADAQVRLRMSCIAAIGTLGGTDDVSLLERLAKDQESRISRAARCQLKELKRRLKIH